jgi:hypothetical protein
MWPVFKPAGNWHHKMPMTVLAPAAELLRLPPMAQGSDTTLTAGIKSFAAGHGGAKAVIEYLGKRGARIVLVGHDGEWGDQFADGTDVAREACESAGVEVENEWERELMEQMRPSNDLWRSMSRRAMAR